MSCHCKWRDGGLRDNQGILCPVHDQVAIFDELLSEDRKKHPHWDDPEMDATDSARHAWWRGNDAGVRTTVRLLNEALLDDSKPRRFSYEPLSDLYNRLVDIRLRLAAEK